MKRRREITIERDVVPLFDNFYQEYHNTYDRLPVYAYSSNRYWIPFSADDEFMVLALLKFELEVLNPWGTSIQFDD